MAVQSVVGGQRDRRIEAAIDRIEDADDLGRLLARIGGHGGWTPTTGLLVIVEQVVIRAHEDARAPVLVQGIAA